MAAHYNREQVRAVIEHMGFEKTGEMKGLVYLYEYYELTLPGAKGIEYTFKMELGETYCAYTAPYAKKPKTYSQNSSYVRRYLLQSFEYYGVNPYPQT